MSKNKSTSSNGLPMELYKKYRPKKLEDIIGQPEAVHVLAEMIESNRVPHSIIFSGGSGVGKTTLSRILARMLGCSFDDYDEINASESRGIDTIREINSCMGLSPLHGKCRVWCLDEAANLTRRSSGGDAQTALLKILEDTPSHVYFFLCTTNPEELIPTIHTRCTEIKLKSLLPGDLIKLLHRVYDGEGKKLSDEVTNRIVEASEGSARKALVLLHQVIGLKSEEEQLEIIQKPSVRRQAFDIVKCLLWEKSSWSDVVKILQDVEEDPESIRRLVLANATKEMLRKGGKSARAYLVIMAFENSFFSSGKSGLVRACYEVLQNN